jgi:hypothetical protein
MNLLMTAPLLDSRGNLRYFIGAQIDVTGLVKDGTDLDAWQHLRERQQSGETQEELKDEFQELSKMFNNSELETVRKHGGNMHRDVTEHDDASTIHMKPRVLIQDQSTFDSPQEEQKLNPKIDGRLSGPYKHVSFSTMSTWTYTNPPISIYFSVLHLHYVSFSLLLLYEFLAFCSRSSSNASAATTVCALRSGTPSPMQLAA